jgi:hypothetical protein
LLQAAAKGLKRARSPTDKYEIFIFNRRCDEEERKKRYSKRKKKEDREEEKKR